METARKTDYRFKILYAFGIILVLCAHADGGALSILKEWFPYDGTYLALFAFSSGYFYRRGEEKDIPKYILRKIRKLIIPLYLYNLLYAGIVQLSRLKGFEIGEDPSFYSIFVMPITNGHQFLYNMGGWFLIPLFMIEVYNILLRRIFSRVNGHTSEWLFFVTSVLLGMAGNYLAGKGYNTGWWLVLTRMLFFLPFFGFGGFYREIFEQFEKKIPNAWYFSLIFALKLLINIKYRAMPTFVPAWCEGFVFSPATSIISGYLVILFWMRIFTAIEPLLGRNRLVNLIADNTYTIMINHFMGFMLVKTLCGLLSHVLPAFRPFDWVAYKTDIWWFYYPEGARAFLTVYVVAGIALPLLVKKLVLLVRQKVSVGLASRRS